MPSVQNQETVAKISEELEGIASMWIVDYRGLTVREVQQLRRDIRSAGAQMKVYKNTLMHLALEGKELPTMDDLLEGPNAFVFAPEDPAAAAKALKTFAKGNENLVIKGGIMDGEVYDAQQVEAIASLPSKEELMGMLAGAINSIAGGIATGINGVPRGIAQTVSQVAEQKPAA